MSRKHRRFPLFHQLLMSSVKFWRGSFHEAVQEVDDNPLFLPVDLLYYLCCGRDVGLFPAPLHYIHIITARFEDVNNLTKLLTAFGNNLHADEFEPVISAVREMNRLFFWYFNEPPVERPGFLRRIISGEEKERHVPGITY